MKYRKPYVWQMACRKVEVLVFGRFYTYFILDRSITDVCSAPYAICADHNRGSHHGRRLTVGCGKVAGMHCLFDGWQWGLRGRNLTVVNQDDLKDPLVEEDTDLSLVDFGQREGWRFPISNGQCRNSLPKARRIADPYQ